MNDGAFGMLWMDKVESSDAETVSIKLLRNIE
jgi:hypothetical protein